MIDLQRSVMDQSVPGVAWPVKLAKLAASFMQGRKNRDPEEKLVEVRLDGTGRLVEKTVGDASWRNVAY
ncbi:MAG: hypothetical protein E6Q98_10325 [Rhodospirillaceae bacterium]|nr:MAG: hypothetical protein E6Q98_10325 [Rhodospirillaceae bacterium]